MGTPLVRACIYSIERNAIHFLDGSVSIEQLAFPNLSLRIEGKEQRTVSHMFTGSELWEEIPEPATPIKRPLV